MNTRKKEYAKVEPKTKRNARPLKDGEDLSENQLPLQGEVYSAYCYVRKLDRALSKHRVAVIIAEKVILLYKRSGLMCVNKSNLIGK